MNPKDDAAPLSVAKEHLQAALAAAEAEAADKKSDVDVARLHYDVAKHNVRSLHKALTAISRDKGTSLNKETVRGCLSQILANGPLPKTTVANRVKDEVRKLGISPNGIALVLGPLAKEFAQSDGTWAIAKTPAKT